MLYDDLPLNQAAGRLCRSMAPHTDQRNMTTPQELKHIVSEGLLSFPVTDFDQNGDFNARNYAQRLEWLAPYGATALFAAGGTGEFFSLAPEEYADVIRTAVQTCAGKVPILAGAGGPTRTAIAYAQEAERLGAKGILLLPHYLTEASQQGRGLCRGLPGAGRAGLFVGRVQFRAAYGHGLLPRDRRGRP